MKHMLAAVLLSSLPNHATTPGAGNPDIAQRSIAQTICNRGHWSTDQVRPPSSYTNALKRRQLANRNGVRLADFEEDHLIPLTLGGNPRDPRNLWPQPWAGQWNAHVKDRLEIRLNRLVCAGKLTLVEAQQAISTDWVAAYRRYVAAKPHGLRRVIH